MASTRGGRRIDPVTEELGGADGVQDLLVGFEAGGLGAALPSGLGPGALGVHLRLESLDVHLAAPLRRYLPGEVDREPVGVVQPEGQRTGQDDPGPGVLQRVVQHPHSRVQGAAELRLLALEHMQDEVEVGGQLGVGVGHHLGGHRRQPRHDHVPAAQLPGMADRPADQAPHHVAAAFVAGYHPVSDQEGGGPGMVGQQAQGHVHLLRLPVGAAQRTGGGEKHILDAVHLEQRVHPLEDHRQPLQPGAGVDALGGQVADDAVGLVLDVLHEDQVPQLDVAVLSAADRTALAPVPRAPVYEDLRGRSARTRHAHLPEVVLAAPLDPLRGRPDPVLPYLLRLVVGLMDGVPEQLGVQPQRSGNQVVGVADGLFLEVVAKGEVPQHLEHRQVPGGGADEVDVHRAHALLDAGRPRPRRGFLSQEVGLEGHHAGVGEQQGGIGGYQGRRRPHRVIALGEEVDEGAPDLVGLHDGARLAGRPAHARSQDTSRT